MIDAQPPRGAFDYLLDPIRDQLQPPPPAPECSLQPIITRRAAKQASVGGLIVVAIVGLIIFAVLAWGLPG